MAVTFLDPQYKPLLTSEQIKEAKKMLLSESSKMSNLTVCDRPSDSEHVKDESAQEKSLQESGWNTLQLLSLSTSLAAQEV